MRTPMGILKLKIPPLVSSSFCSLLRINQILFILSCQYNLILGNIRPRTTIFFIGLFMELVNFSKATINDLLGCDYEKIIESCEDDTDEYRHAFSKAGRDAYEQGDIAKFHALGFLSCACSLTLRSSDSKLPFEPMIVDQRGNTSTQYFDFSKDDCKLMMEFSEHVKSPELVARLADLSWIVRRDYISAKKAIDSYIKSSRGNYCKKDWSVRITRLERALRLSFMVNDKDAIDVLKDELVNSMGANHSHFSYMATGKISNLLLEFGLLDADILGEKILTLIEMYKGDYKFQNELYDAASRAFMKSKNNDMMIKAKIMSAEALVAKANEMKRPGGMIAASHWLSLAIAIFQQCEGQANRVATLQKEMVLINQECHKEMKSFSVSTDITEMVNNSVLAMQNKDIRDTLLRFAYLMSPMSKKRLTEQALKIAQGTAFQATASKRILNGDGRLVALIPPLLGSKGEDYDLALNWATHYQATQSQSLFVNGVIIPARDELLRQHQISRDSLRDVLHGCAFFPPGRENLWLKGFVYGFHNDFDAALSILIPQFEHALRKCLESRGALVWRVDPSTQFHSEKSLNELFKMQEADDFLGEDLKFTLQGLLTEKISANFRNESTHGLMDEDVYYSPSAVYLWWLLFHMTIVLNQRIYKS